MSKNVVLFRALRGIALLALALFAATIAIQSAKAAENLPAMADILSERVLGKDDAPVTLVEYASLTCPHCASFAKDVLPTIKKEYVDTGKVKLIYRDYPLDNLALRAAMMARCAPKERYFGLVETLFATQGNWARAADPAAALQRLGAVAGLNADNFEACMANKEIYEGVMTIRAKGEADKLTGTPYFMLEGRPFKGDPSVAEFRKQLDAAVAAKGK
jgi:protein-disulfide isomerase